jgi:hypothetical protein
MPVLKLRAEGINFPYGYRVCVSPEIKNIRQTRELGGHVVPNLTLTKIPLNHALRSQHA